MSERPWPPTPMPVNVQVELVDGTVIPVDMRYVGLDNGCHLWVTVQEFKPEQVKAATCDQLPAGVAFGITFEADDAAD